MNKSPWWVEEKDKIINFHWTNTLRLKEIKTFNLLAPLWKTKLCCKRQRSWSNNWLWLNINFTINISVCLMRELKFRFYSFKHLLPSGYWWVIWKVLTEVGRISGPKRNSRRCQETLKVAQALHGATPDNMLPVYEGIIAALNVNCSDPELNNMVRKCPKFSEKVIPRVVKDNINVFEKCDANFERSVMFCTEGEL